MDYFKIVIGLFLTFNALSQISAHKTWWFIQNVNLIFHEAGHVLFMPFGNFMTTLGGSLLEILIPFSITAYFYFTRQYFSASCTSWWLATAFLSVSIYASDAQERFLPLITRDIFTHDWFNILSELGLLKYDDLFGYFFWCGSILSVGILIFTLSKDTGVYQLLLPTPQQNTTDNSGIIP